MKIEDLSPHSTFYKSYDFPATWILLVPRTTYATLLGEERVGQGGEDLWEGFFDLLIFDLLIYFFNRE